MLRLGPFKSKMRNLSAIVWLSPAILGKTKYTFEALVTFQGPKPRQENQSRTL